MSTQQILASGFLLLFASTCVFFPGRHLVRRVLQLRRLSSSVARPLAGLAAGQPALVQGMAVGELHPSPVAQTPCLFWHLRVYRLIRRPRRMPERRTSWRHRADRALTIVDGSMMVEIELTEADLSLLGTEVQLTMSRASTANGARSVTTERRPAVAVSPLAPVAQTVVWTSVPLTPEIIERLRPLGFRPSWMWWERSQTFVDELCVLPRAPLLALGWVTGPDEYGRLRLRSRAGERLIVATQDIEQLAGNLRSEIRLGVFVCVVFAVFLVGGCLLTALVL